MDSVSLTPANLEFLRERSWRKDPISVDLDLQDETRRRPRTDLEVASQMGLGYPRSLDPLDWRLRVPR